MEKVKYNEEMKLQTVMYVLGGGKSATKVARELGIDTNTVCRWMREYRDVQGSQVMKLSNGLEGNLPTRWRPESKSLRMK